MKKKHIIAEFPEEIEKASVSFWYVKEGEEIEIGQNLIEFVTEKTSFTYVSPFSCKIIALLVKEGDEVMKNQKIAEVEIR
ncbi:MAG: lipoyl domain-containing protein [Candidatus Omnitrophica bacterium]|nr:lipoyl domain-containing protein [Candidatus Omnitrophota bacterium]MCM8829360.1 lipoyl domain-containing protein [Candidatus Omnitrophota bacterium]